MSAATISRNSGSNCGWRSSASATSGMSCRAASLSVAMPLDPVYNPKQRSVSEREVTVEHRRDNRWTQAVVAGRFISRRDPHELSEDVVRAQRLHAPGRHIRCDIVDRIKILWNDI